jgi:transposase
MPAPVPVPRRRLLLRLHRQGLSTSQIADRLGLATRTVRSLLRRLTARGAAGLAPSYHRGHPEPGPAVQLALETRRRHPAWGAEYIRTRLLLSQPDLDLPCTRTLQRHLAHAGLAPVPAGRKPLPYRDRAAAVHDVWQMDASEAVKLKDGQKVSWLRLVDECSGAFLQTRVFPPREVGEGRDRRGARGAARGL